MLHLFPGMGTVGSDPMLQPRLSWSGNLSSPETGLHAFKDGDRSLGQTQNVSGSS